MELFELTVEQKKELAQKAWENPVWFCEYFLSSLFPTPMPWIHRGLLAIMLRRCDFLQDDPELQKIIDNFFWLEDTRKEEHEPEERNYIFYLDEDGKLQMDLRRFTLIMMPRGFAKTTVAGVAVQIYNILFQENPFSCYISEAGPHAKMQLATVRFHLTDNRKIKAVFGELRPKMSDDEKWSEDFFETKTGMAMVARGRGGQIRGLNHKGNRPKHIICDDLEDLESVATDAQRNKTRIWFYADVVNALPEADPTSTITVLGTLLHEDALLMTLADDPDWTVVKMAVLDVSEEPVWPRVMNEARITAKKQSFASAGLLHIFFMEFFNRLIVAEAQLIKKEYWQYEQPKMEEIVGRALYMDPAVSEKRTADKTAIAAVGITKKGKIWIFDIWSKRTSDELEKIDAYFAMSKRWQIPTIGGFHGVESNAYQAALVHRMREEMFRRGHYFELVPVTNKTKKVSRIKQGLIQPLAAGYILCARRFFTLEIEGAEFREDGSHKHDDELDGVAGAIQLLSPFAPAAAGTDMMEDQYPPLEEVFQGDWRWA